MSLPVNFDNTLPPGTLPTGFPVGELPTGEEVKKISSLFHDNSSVKFQFAHGKGIGEKGLPFGMPALDGIDEDLAGILDADMMLSMLGDLEKILAESMSESNEKQVTLAKERIEMLKDQIAKTKQERLDKVADTMKEMEKAATQRALTKALGWMMAIFAVIFAVATCIVTGGATAAFAVGAAAAAVTCQVLNETGVMDKLTDKLTESLRKAGHSKKTAMILAQICTALIQIGATLLAGGVCYGVGTGLASVARATTQTAVSSLKLMLEDAAKVMLPIAKASLSVGGLAMAGMGIYNAIMQYDAGMEQVKLKELESFIARLQQGMDETEEELQKLVEQLQALVAKILGVLTNPLETTKEIENNFV